MGIDVHLIWDDMTDDDRLRQTMCDLPTSILKARELREIEQAGGTITADMLMGSIVSSSPASRGAAGYIREGYGISPFPSALLVREAFEARDGTAAITAAVMRERLHSVTEPAARNIGSFMRWFHKHAAGPCFPDAPYVQTEPASVWECVQQRCRHAGEAGSDIDPADMMANYVGFVECAEQHERQQGHPCTVHVSR